MTPKIDELRAIASSLKPSIIIVSETWFHDEITNDEIVLSNYAVPYRKDRSGKRGGGVCVYLSSDSCVSRLLSSSNNTDVYESLWIQIPELNILLFAAYIPPNLTTTDMKILERNIISEAEMFLENFNGHRVFMAGDFNQFKTERLEDILNLKQLVCEATRGKSILDKILINAELSDSFQRAIIGPNLGKSDHHTILINPVKTKPKTIKFKKLYDFRESNLEVCKQTLATYPWQYFYRSTMTVDEKCNLFHDILDSALSSIPHEKVPVSQNDKPWITPLIKSLINRRYAAFRAQNFPLYEHFKKKVDHEIFKAKQNWIKNANQSSKNLWNMVNNIRNKKHDGYLSGLISSFDSLQNAANEINKALSRHFLDNTQSLIVVESKNKHLTWNPIVDVQTVFNHLRKLKKSKSAGSDNLSPRFLTYIADVIAGPLTHIICLSIEECRVPKRWKVANICPVPKKSRPSIDDLRPISMLPIFSKIIEKIILSSVKSTLISLYGSQQFGFRPFSSTLHAHISLHDFITSCLDQKETVSVMLISTDLKSAFDSLCHNSLLRTLERGHLPNHFIKWCRNYLQDRFQRVLLDFSTLSEEIQVTSGVPQGSVLAPYLFAAHMGSLGPCHTNAKMFKYADDVMTAIPITKTLCPNTIIRDELEHINTWCDENGLKLNPDKTKVLMITKKGHRIIPFANEYEKYLSDELKILGVHYNSQLNWTSHTTKICKNARRHFYILRQLKFSLEKRDLITIYKSVIMSALEYCCPLYIGLDAHNAKTIESIRKQCHRIICGKDCECEQFEEISKRRRRQALLFFEGMKSKSNLLHNVFPQTHAASGKLVMPYCRTERRLSSFIPQCIILSNTSHKKSDI